METRIFNSKPDIGTSVTSEIVEPFYGEKWARGGAFCGGCIGREGWVPDDKDRINLNRGPG
jgi:hypothetical protein